MQLSYVVRQLLCVLLMLSLQVKAEHKQAVVDVLSTEWRPFLYIENGEAKGFAYQIMQDVMAEAELEFRFYTLPWPRVYSFGISEQNYIILGLSRTPVREKLFHWIGPVALGERVYLYKVKGTQITLEHLSQARQYNFAVEKHTHYYDFLNNNGFHKDKLYIVTKTEQILKMAVRGRIDLFLSTENGLLNEAKKANIPPDSFEMVLTAYEIQDYMALSKKSSPQLHRKLLEAYQTLAHKGKVNLR